MGHIKLRYMLEQLDKKRESFLYYKIKQSTVLSAIQR